MSNSRLIAFVCVAALIGVVGAVTFWQGSTDAEGPLVGGAVGTEEPDNPRTQGGTFGGNVAPGQEPPINEMPEPVPDAPVIIANETAGTDAPVAESPAVEMPPQDEPIVIEEGPTRSIDDNKGYIDIPVYFATNRALNPEPDPDLPASQFLDTNGPLVWGNGVVSIPRIHRMGQLESQGWLASILFDPDPEKHVVLQAMTPGELETIRSWVMEDLAATDNSVLMYVHGYNTSLNKAMRRAGQLTYDLGWDGPSFLFSWPSQGEALDYFKDSTLAERSIFAMRDTLAELASLEADRIVIIAHSMGTRVLSQGLAELARDDPDAANQISTVILAAPDIDEQVFHSQLAPRFQLLTRSHFTLYASAEDSALKLSKSANGFPRIGDTTNGVPVLDGIDVIDATGVVSDFFGHTYFGDNASILSDIFTMVHDNTPLDARPLVKLVEQNGQEVWKIVVD